MVEAAGLCGPVRGSVTSVWEDMHGSGSQAPVLVLLPFVSEASPPPSPSGRGRHTWDGPPILITVPLISLRLGWAIQRWLSVSLPAHSVWLHTDVLCLCFLPQGSPEVRDD